MAGFDEECVRAQLEERLKLTARPEDGDLDSLAGIGVVLWLATRGEGLTLVSVIGGRGKAGGTGLAGCSSGGVVGVGDVGVMAVEGGGGWDGLSGEGVVVVGAKRGGLVVAIVAQLLCSRNVQCPYGNFGKTKTIVLDHGNTKTTALNFVDQSLMGGCFIRSVSGWNWRLGVVWLGIEGWGGVWDVGRKKRAADLMETVPPEEVKGANPFPPSSA